MKTGLQTLVVCTTVIILSAFPFTNVVAVDGSGASSVYDEAAYTANMETAIKKLDKLYLNYTNKSLSGGEIEKAKREYFMIARQILGDMNDRFDNLNPKKGAALSHTELLYMNHIQIMLIDMLAGEHEMVWESGDTVY